MGGFDRRIIPDPGPLPFNASSELRRVYFGPEGEDEGLIVSVRVDEWDSLSGVYPLSARVMLNQGSGINGWSFDVTGSETVTELDGDIRSQVYDEEGYQIEDKVNNEAVIGSCKSRLKRGLLKMGAATLAGVAILALNRNGIIAEGDEMVEGVAVTGTAAAVIIGSALAVDRLLDLKALNLSRDRIEREIQQLGVVSRILREKSLVQKYLYQQDSKTVEEL